MTVQDIKDKIKKGEMTEMCPLCLLVFHKSTPACEFIYTDKCPRSKGAIDLK